MKDIKWRKKNILILSILFIIGMFAYNYTTRRLDNKVKSIFDDCGYTVGTVDVFLKVPLNSGGVLPHVEYRYKVGGDEINGEGGYYFMPLDGVEKGEKYIVLYSNKDVRNSVMLFKYPIKQDVDFEKYLEEFKINPPKFISRKRFMFF